MYGEFGRTPKINATGGRDHWGSLVASRPSSPAEGIRGGTVYGPSSDAHAAYPRDHPVSPRRHGRHDLPRPRSPLDLRNPRPRGPPLSNLRRSPDHRTLRLNSHPEPPALKVNAVRTLHLFGPLASPPLAIHSQSAERTHFWRGTPRAFRQTKPISARLPPRLTKRSHFPRGRSRPALPNEAKSTPRRPPATCSAKRSQRRKTLSVSPRLLNPHHALLLPYRPPAYALVIALNWYHRGGRLLRRRNFSRGRFGSPRPESCQ